MRPPKKIYRPVPPDSPSTSLVGLEQAIPPGRSLPGLKGRPSNLNKPLPELPRELTTPEAYRRHAAEGGVSFTCHKDRQGLSGKASQCEGDAYDKWWNQQDNSHNEPPVFSETKDGERNSQCVSLRGFLSDQSEVDRYIDTTPLKVNPYMQENKRAATFPKPKGLPRFQTSAASGFGWWRRSRASGSRFLVGDEMSQRSLVPAPLNLSSERMTSVDALSRFSSSDSEAIASRSPSIRDSVLSYMRKMFLRKNPSRKKGKLPATALSSVGSVDFPEGRIPPHYTREYDIEPKVSTPVIQQEVADLEKRMRKTSMSSDSDRSDCRCEFESDRVGGDGRGKYRNEEGEGSPRSEGCRSSGPRRRYGQQLAIPTSPYQKYGPKIWDPPGIEKIRQEELTKKNKKGWLDGVGYSTGLKIKKFGIMDHAFKTKNNTASPRAREGGWGPAGPRSPSLPQPNYWNPNQSQNQIRSGRTGSQLTGFSKYVQAFYRGTDEVTEYYETVKKKLEITGKEERRRRNLKKSIIVLKPMNRSVGRSQSEQWV